MRRLRALVIAFALFLLISGPAAAQNFFELKPSPSPVAGITPVPPTGITMTGLVAKSSAGNLYSFLGTTGAVPGCYFIFNATTIPSTGGVTFGSASGNAIMPPIQALANSTTSVDWRPGPPAVLSVGITIGFSSTCGATFTQSATSSIGAMIQ